MHRKTLLTSIAALGSAILAGCAVGPNQSAPAPLTTARDYRSPADLAKPGPFTLGESVARDWWSLFPSPELDRVIRQALAGNPGLAAANASLGAARAELAVARGAQSPDLNASAGPSVNRLNLASFGFSGGPFPNNPQFDLYSVGATAAYPLDVFGGLKRGVESAAANTEAQHHQLDAAWLTLTGQVATQAAAIAALRAELATVEQIIADDRQNLELVRKAEAAGGEPRSAGVSASSQLAADETLAPPIRRQLDMARHALAVLVGKAPSDWSAPDFELSSFPLPQHLPVAMPSELVHQRPDILAAEARYRAATSDVGVATARLYPSLTLSAQITQGALKPENVFNYKSTAYALAGGAGASLFDGGRLKAGVRAARSRREQALDLYQQTVLGAFGQVADLMQAIVHDQEMLAAQSRAQTHAQESVRLARLAYGAGATGLFPFLDASRQLNTSRLGLVRAEAQLRFDAIGLFVATGRGSAKGA